jgi:hypothetical protein
MSHFRALPLAVAVGVVAWCAPPSEALDRWEIATVSSPSADGNSQTGNEPRHGDVQTAHDFHTTTDQDWVRIRTHPRRSYEVRVSSGTVPWASGSCPALQCATLAMVDAAGNVMMPGGSDGVPTGPAGFSSVRWGTADLTETYYVRAMNATDLTTLTYDLTFRETTLFLPRFNNTGSQGTVMIVQNAHATSVAGHIHFYDAGGQHLHSQTFGLAPNATLVFATNSIPALQNVSGSATVAHTAPYGGLAGKAVALEPATGFTFDTALTPLP